RRGARTAQTHACADRAECDQLVCYDVIGPGRQAATVPTLGEGWSAPPRIGQQLAPVAQRHVRVPVLSHPRGELGPDNFGGVRCHQAASVLAAISSRNVVSSELNTS